MSKKTRLLSQFGKESAELRLATERYLNSLDEVQRQIFFTFSPEKQKRLVFEWKLQEKLKGSRPLHGKAE
jgi:hypothetical protein